MKIRFFLTLLLLAARRKWGPFYIPPPPPLSPSPYTTEDFSSLLGFLTRKGDSPKFGKGLNGMPGMPRHFGESGKEVGPRNATFFRRGGRGGGEKMREEFLC